MSSAGGSSPSPSEYGHASASAPSWTPPAPSCSSKTNATPPPADDTQRCPSRTAGRTGRRRRPRHLLAGRASVAVLMNRGGTSGASPIVASLEADARQSGGHAIGFAKPLLYDLRHSAGIRDIVPPASPALVLEPNCYAPAGPARASLPLHPRPRQQPDRGARLRRRHRHRRPDEPVHRRPRPRLTKRAATAHDDERSARALSGQTFGARPGSGKTESILLPVPAGLAARGSARRRLPW